MAAATVTVPTGSSTLVKLGRKVQGPLFLGYSKECPEYGWHTKLDKFTLGASQREITAPLDIRRAAGLGSSIIEGSYEARPFTPAPNELTFTFIHRNYRYALSRTTELLSGSQGAKAYVFDQLKFQARKIKEAMKEHFSLATYGYSTGIICKTTTAATQASGTYTLSAAYGEADLTNTSFLVQPFAIGSVVMLLNPAGPALRTNGIGTVTAIGTGTTDITWAGSVTSVSGDQIVFANSMENATLAGGSDYNLHPVGLLDIANTASVHGLSSATESYWNVGLSDTSGGRFGFVKYRRGQYAINNRGGGDPDTCIIAQGVEADLTDQLSAAVRYNNTMALQLDGATQIKGVEFRTSRYVPNSRVWLCDSENFKLWEPAGQMPDESGVLPDSNNNLVITDKLQDISGKTVGVDYLYARITNNRSNFAYFNGLTEAY